jgi:hypothetical protein
MINPYLCVGGREVSRATVKGDSALGWDLDKATFSISKYVS